MTRNTCVRPMAVLATMLCLRMSGQSQGIEFTVRGELFSSTPRLFSEYAIDLVETGHRGTSGRVEVRADGRFEMPHMAPGEYTLTVTTIRGEPLQQQAVSLSANSGPVEVRLSDPPARARGAQTISVKVLLHPPTRKAFRSFVEAQHFSESGDFKKAAEALERAVQDSPGYAEAHVNLGAQYVRIGRLEEAIAEFQRAMEIAGPSTLVLCNLASAQSRLGRVPEAIESARWALRLDSGSPQGHLLLGALLARDPRTRAEGIPHLERVSDQFESARRILADMRKR